MTHTHDFADRVSRALTLGSFFASDDDQPPRSVNEILVENEET